MADNKPPAARAPEFKSEPKSEPKPEARPGTGSLAEPKPGDAKVLGGPAPQGDNPKDKGTALGVTPNTQNAEEIVTPWPGPDHEAVLRAAKYAGAQGAGGKHVDDLESIGQDVAEARALVAQRNVTTDGSRVKEIDARLNELGFANPVATTEAQRRGLEPLGRQQPGASKA
jgi:hypothetical protein